MSSPLPRTVEAAFRQIDERAASVSEIERVERASREQINQALAENRPLIVSRLPGVPACFQSMEALAERFPGLSITTTHGALRLSAFVEKIQSSPVDGAARELPSTMVGDSTEVPAALLPGLMKMPFFDGLPARYFEFFMGAAGTATSLHRDAFDGLCMNFFGRKRWWFVSPSQVALLRPIHSLEGFQRSSVDPRDAAGLQLLAERGVRLVEFVAGPGDLIVVPKGWFHFVVALDPALSVRVNL